uniref:Uncharacterized protein n=1 Tax=Oryzias latipes TaxID=8090 RepID=H2MQJ7_ORYLA
MGVLSTLIRGLVRGADRMSEFTSKRGSRTHNKGRGARPAGLRLSSGKFVAVRAMIPEFVVPSLEGFKLRPSGKTLKKAPSTQSSCRSMALSPHRKGSSSSCILRTLCASGFLLCTAPAEGTNSVLRAGLCQMNKLTFCFCFHMSR